MHQTNTLRELTGNELDLVGGGLSASAGLNVNLGSEFKAVSGLTGQVGGLVENLAGGALKSVGGVVGGLLGAV